MDVIKSASISIFFLTLTFLSVLLYRKANTTLDNIEKTSGAVAQYVEDQKAQLTSEKNRKAIDAGIAAAASLQGTIRLVNTTTIPRVNSVLQELELSAQSLRDFTNKTSDTVNTQTLPKAGQAIDAVTNSVNLTGHTIEHFDESVKLLPKILYNTQLTMDEVRDIIADPSFKHILTNLDQSSQNIADLTNELKASGAYAPSIMKNVEAISATTSKYRKAVLLSQIISAVSRAFF